MRYQSCCFEVGVKGSTFFLKRQKIGSDPIDAHPYKERARDVSSVSGKPKQVQMVGAES